MRITDVTLERHPPGSRARMTAFGHGRERSIPAVDAYATLKTTWIDRS